MAGVAGSRGLGDESASESLGKMQETCSNTVKMTRIHTATAFQDKAKEARSRLYVSPWACLQEQQSDGGGRTGHVEKGGRLCLCLCLCVSVCARVCVCVCVYVFELRWLLVIADRRVLVS